MNCSSDNHETSCWHLYIPKLYLQFLNLIHKSVYLYTIIFVILCSFMDHFFKDAKFSGETMQFKKNWRKKKTRFERAESTNKAWHAIKKTDKKHRNHISTLGRCYRYKKFRFMWEVVDRKLKSSYCIWLYIRKYSQKLCMWYSGCDVVPVKRILAT